MLKKSSVLVLSALLAGCASRASEIEASYVSSVPYRTLTCDQLSAEAAAVSQRATAATGAQNKRAMDDAAAMTIGLIVFWPALFLMRGDGAQAAELSRLKGEMDAIVSAGREKGCLIELRQPSPQQTASVAASEPTGRHPGDLKIIPKPECSGPATGCLNR